MPYTQHQIRFFAEQLLLKRPQSSIDGLASAMSGSKVDLNPHQVDAALFALHSPLSGGVLMADEVGLGKTIEAGLVMAQRWSEHKRKILLIVPASLRTQWRAELDEKFFIPSMILESKNYNKAKKDDSFCNPFMIQDTVVICSYNFASQKRDDVSRVPWDLVIMDEAHRLRNVYKNSNVIGRNLKSALQRRKKLLLTATPLQNNLMELYGLVGIIDAHVFGDAATFRDMYVSVRHPATRNSSLRGRLQNICKRTLRRQVREYVPYTERQAITQPYTPSSDEETLYNEVSAYLQRTNLHAFAQGQRQLITLVARKLLASSSMAIHGTLSTIIDRLQLKLTDYQAQLSLSDFDDYDGIDELLDNESNGDDQIASDTLAADCEGIRKEIEELTRYAELAAQITTNAKGDNLLTALNLGFERNEEVGGARKAVIFTESRRTQTYLMNLLSDNGYDGEIVFLDGTNSDPVSKRIYSEWRERHKNDAVISGSRQADIKAAFVEEFRDRATILIGTEAAAEGINLQFCNIVVNYDLPWNPQRVEQRIGRCHRYGQKNDVIVINFLNQTNAADQRVFQLLDQKFRLFEGVFGSSDEILGVIEDGVDFEKRILNIYQTCREPEEIKAAFDQLQSELSEQIDERMTETRQSLMENFDEDVAALLKVRKDETKLQLDKFTDWLRQFFIMSGAERVEPLDQLRFAYTENGEQKIYNLQWRDAESQHDIFLRRDDPMCQEWLVQSIEKPVPPVAIQFQYTDTERNIGFLSANPNLKGIVLVDKLVHKGLSDEEHLIISAIAEDGTLIYEDTVGKIMELPAVVVGDCTPEAAELAAQRQAGIEMVKEGIESRNKTYYLEECMKLDAFSKDLEDGLEKGIKAIRKEIDEKTKAWRQMQNTESLDVMLAVKDEIDALENRKTRMQREIYTEQDRIQRQKKDLQAQIRQRLNGEVETQTIMTFSFEIV
jgi:ERCC4-related helicase